MADAVVVGAGISGAATAYQLAKDGLKVTLIDRFQPAAMASGWTLAGVRQSGRDPVELPLARAAVDLWATLDEELDAPTHYRRSGNLRVARDETEIAMIREVVRSQSAAGLDITLLPDNRAVREVAPALSEKALLASYCTSDGSADPFSTVLAFVRAAERLGATCRFGDRVLRLETEGGRVTGVVTDKGRIATERVVIAAGIFGNELLSPFGVSGTAGGADGDGAAIRARGARAGSGDQHGDRDGDGAAAIRWALAGDEWRRGVARGVAGGDGWGGVSEAAGRSDGAESE